MLLTSARSLLNQAARNAKDSTEYTPAQQDRALDLLGKDFCRRTKVLKQTDSLATVIGSSVLDFSGLTGFRPERLLKAYVVNPPKSSPLPVISWEDLLELQNCPSGPAGAQPQAMAFESWSVAGLDVIADKVYTIKFLWTPPFTSWTIGTQGAWSGSQKYYVDDVVASGGTLYQCIATHTNQVPPNATYWISLGAGTLVAPSAVSFNIPDDWMSQAVWLGGAALLQENEPEHAFAGPKWQAYLAFVKDVMNSGAGTLAEQVHVRPDPRPGTVRKRRQVRNWWEG